MKEYYDRRAPEYDDWYTGARLFRERDRAGWEDELTRLVDTIAALPAARTLDVACGTGFLTRHLRGDVVGLDQSARMLDEARQQAPRASYVRGDALALPFPNDSFHRVFTAHFYGHLEPADRETFLEEARRVARACDDRRGVAGARAQRRVALAGVQALLHAGVARRGAGPR